MWRFTAGRWPGKDFHRNTGKICASEPPALEQMAEDMFRSVDAVYASLVLMPLERVEIRSSFCRFAADVPDMERAEEIAEEAEREGEIDGRMWLKEVKRLLDEGIQSSMLT